MALTLLVLVSLVYPSSVARLAPTLYPLSHPLAPCPLALFSLSILNPFRSKCNWRKLSRTWRKTEESSEAAHLWQEAVLHVMIALVSLILLALVCSALLEASCVVFRAGDSWHEYLHDDSCMNTCMMRG